MNYLYITRPLHPLRWVFASLTVALFILTLLIFLIIGPKKMVSNARNLAETPTTRIIPKMIPIVSDPNAVAIEHRAMEITHLLQRRWEGSLLAVEKITTKEVTVLEFHPDYHNGKIALQGEAREFDALAEYIKQLNATGLVHDVTLMHEQAVSHEHINTIEFELNGDL